MGFYLVGRLHLLKKLTKKDFHDFYDKVFEGMGEPDDDSEEDAEILDQLWIDLEKARRKLEKAGYIKKE